MIARRRRLLQVRTLTHERARADEAKARLALEYARQGEHEAAHQFDGLAGTTVSVHILQSCTQEFEVAQQHTHACEIVHQDTADRTVATGRAWLRAARSLEKAEQERQAQHRAAEQRELDEFNSRRRR